ncbi:hypothetical protein EON65_25195 [archaeon]|nr:MAG: hypothetical protein EON65_25195 [archaeon]
MQTKSSFLLKVYLYGFIALSLWLMQFSFYHDRAQAGLRTHRGLEERVVVEVAENNISRSLMQTTQQSLTDNNVKEAIFEELVDIYLEKPNAHTDLEIVDLLEQFFWGKGDGIAMEIGIKSMAHSMTNQLHRIGWKRILLEGDPRKWRDIKSAAIDAKVIAAPICQRSQVLHYVSYPESAAGILEFMSKDFLRAYHYAIFEACNPPGDLSSISNWPRFLNVTSLECHPASVILKSINLQHINFLLLDAAVSAYFLL